jgi:pimeloyl-ACP methyl ester carboxylesterase
MFAWTFPRRFLMLIDPFYWCFSEWRIGAMLLLVLCLSLGADGDAAMEKREAYLEQLQEMIPHSREWKDWLAESGELPPDFEAMPDQSLLPDPLRPLVDGEHHTIATPAAWEKERKRLKQALQHWITGTVPPRPENLKAEIVREEGYEGATVREVELRFGKGHKGKLWLQLFIPPGEGPFPVFMTQDNHRGWGLIALRRGYIACIYAGSDSRDDTGTFIEAYPEYDWSKLMRRGWAAGRCIDYLETEPRADTAKVALTGHSRNGKTSLMGSAFDERIAVVISSSSGTGGCLPLRYCDEMNFAEGIEHITRNFPDWFHPRWRFFVGREHKVPADLHHLVALSAPRPCLLSIALNDGVESTWGLEQTYHAIKPAWDLYGEGGNLAILRRPAGHETWPATIERYIDWCDLHFGRRPAKGFPDRIIHPWNWQTWKARQKALPEPGRYEARPFGAVPASAAAWQARKAAVKDAVLDMLGKTPPCAPAPLADYGLEPDRIEAMLGREEAGIGLEKHDFMFGEYLNADVYMPAGLRDSGEKAPVLLWLHPLCCPKGYAAAYRRGEQVFRNFARAGYAVVCFDQIGTGRRIEEVEGFYEKWPDWSVLGRMLRDTRALLDVIPEMPFLDADRIHVLGYSMGAFAAAHLAAVDERPAAYMLVCAPPPYRLDTDPQLTGGMQRWAQRLMLLPRLGVFKGHENHVPYDIDELLGCMAPRPLLLVTPELDREGPPALMDPLAEAVAGCYGIAGEAGAFTRISPMRWNTFDVTMQDHVIEWLRGTAAPWKKGKQGI